jgi:hypothetical protein
MAKRPKINERTAWFGTLKNDTKFMMPWVNPKQPRLFRKVNSALAQQVGGEGEYKSMISTESVILL